MLSQKVLYFCILVFFILLRWLCLSYDREAAFFPAACLGVGIVVCLLKLLCLYNAKIGRVLDAEGILEGSGRNITSVRENMSTLDEDALEDGIIKSTEGSGQLTVMERFKRELLLVSWCVLMCVAIWFIGFYMASLVMVFLFIKFIGQRPLLPATLIAIVVPIVLYFGFRVGLKIELYTGVLF